MASSAGCHVIGRKSTPSFCANRQQSDKITMRVSGDSIRYGSTTGERTRLPKRCTCFGKGVWPSEPPEHLSLLVDMAEGDRAEFAATPVKAKVFSQMSRITGNR
jgi:hypothetical protein